MHPTQTYFSCLYTPLLSTFSIIIFVSHIFSPQAIVAPACTTAIYMSSIFFYPSLVGLTRHTLRVWLRLFHGMLFNSLLHVFQPMQLHSRKNMEL